MAAIRSGCRNIPPPWDALYGPLQYGAIDDLVVIAQIGQSLDGRIATLSGHSHYINGPDGLIHLHRLRALVDAVVVGVGTAVADDPQLTVRRVAGPSPARVIIDPNGRLPSDARALAEDGVRRLVVGAEQHGSALRADVERVVLPADQGQIEPAAILSALAARGLRRILVEGGAGTISRFLEAGCLDRIHIVVAPIILGAGRASLDVKPIERVEQALRPRTRVHMLGEEVLFDCDLSDQRRVIGRAKKST
jgi:riboflavin-specific deaminase-like protein